MAFVCAMSNVGRKGTRNFPELAQKINSGPIQKWVVIIIFESNMTKSPTIITTRLLLRPIEPSDINNIHLGLSDKDVIRFYGVRFDSLEATKVQMQWYSDLEKNSTGTWWAISSKASGQFFGAIGLNDIDIYNSKAEMGFWLLPQHWGKGLVSEAIPEVINHGIGVTGLHRIEAWVETENRSCKRTLISQGFAKEGTLRDFEKKDGKFICLDVYSVIGNQPGNEKNY